MPWTSLTLPLLLPGYVLILFRVGGLVAATPLLSSTAIPRRVRALFTAAVALVMCPLLLPTIPAELTLRDALVGGVGEILIGVLMGIALQTLFLGAQLAGMVVGQQAGLSLGQVSDPLSGGSSTTLGQVYFIVLSLIFLVAGGHRAIIRGLLDSFQAIPLLSFSAGEVHLGMLIELLQDTYAMGLRLAGPCLIALFMTTVAMGFLSKTMPQLNILSIGFAFKIVTVLFFAGLSIAASGGVFRTQIYETFVEIRTVFNLP